MAESPHTSPQHPSSSSSATAPLGHNLIPVVNKLQDIIAQVGNPMKIDLPQVAVVGSQSSGKSSVLEALVGRDFLPRGTDICTRRPLVLQLVRTKWKADGSEEEWGEFLHVPGKKFYDFSEIRREIEIETDREVGGNKGVSDKQIRLKIFSPNVLDITLVDLPGITKVPVGDQPTDIETRIRTMIMSYIKRPTCIILAVTPANSDLANSDALQIAGAADPDGTRTIGVITKLDIMDRGTDARNLLLGKVIPLRLGYVGVVNRSQEDIIHNVSIKDALVAEEKFFRSRQAYNSIADRCGVPQLAKKLNQILVQHIKLVLPDLKARLRSDLVTVAKEHASYGEITESKAGKGALLLNILSKYSESFTSVLEGKNEGMSTSELSGGARIHYIFQSIFVKCLEEVDPCEELTDDYIRTAIQNSTGPRSALFVPEVPFEVLVRKQMSRLLDPSLQCARFIYDELVEISRRCMVSELQRFPVMRKRVDEVVGDFLREGLEPSETMIGHIIEMEMDYINTSHPNFIGGSKALQLAEQEVKSSRATASLARQKDGAQSDKGAASGKNPEGSSSGKTNGFSFGIFLREPPATLKPTDTRSEQEAVEIAVTKRLLRSYYDIVRKNIEDAVPKAIMHFLVNHTKRELHNVFIRKLYRENLFDEILQEPEEIAKRRKETWETLRALQLAMRTLDELPLEGEGGDRGNSLGGDATGLPKIHGMPSSSFYNTSSGSHDSFSASPKPSRSRKSSSHSGELQSPFHPNADANGNGRAQTSVQYPAIHI
ncbi:unnamed protein product [Rhodiola kirilowii]